MKRSVLMAVTMGVAWLCVLAPCGGVSAHEAAQENEVQSLSLHYYRGIVFFESGQYENALNEFQTVSGTDPYYKDTPGYVKKTLKMLDGYRSQVLGLEKESLEKDGFDLYFLGKSYYEKGDYRRAKEAFNVVLAKNPNDRFAKHYKDLCETALGSPKQAKSKALHPAQKAATEVLMLEKEVNYAKDDLKDQDSAEGFMEAKAQRRVQRDALIQAKERQLRQQEELIEEERGDYLAQAKLTKRAERIQKEAEKWRGMRERLESKEPGTLAELTEFPVYYNKAESYYKLMKESLQASRWNSAGLNAIQAAVMYCDALLIYNCGLRSAYPAHENINQLLKTNIKRADTEEYMGHLRSILSVKKLVEEEDRSLTRKEALFLQDRAEKVVEWCQSILP
jgi:tetratricopeptide (TPR) repeat protein